MKDHFNQEGRATTQAKRVGISGLQMRMSITYMQVTFGIIFSLQIVRILLFFLLKESVLDLVVPFFVDVSALILVPLMGGIFGYVSTRGLIRRLQRLVVATTQFAQGNYKQHVAVQSGDEFGRLEEHFNQMADKLAENTIQLRMLTEQNARLAERTRIARDLHDSVKQQVFAIGMQVGAALSLLDQNTEAARRHIQETDALVYQVQLELTTLIQELRPSHLQEKGLSAALNDYLTSWSRRQGISNESEVETECELSAGLEEVLWRVAQEALSNVARHSKASKVQVSLKRENGRVRLEIKDNGSGFDLGSVKMGMGLQSIRERIEAEGGIVSIKSQEGDGTEINVDCPFQSEKSCKREREESRQ